MFVKLYSNKLELNMNPNKNEILSNQENIKISFVKIKILKSTTNFNKSLTNILDYIFVCKKISIFSHNFTCKYFLEF